MSSRIVGRRLVVDGGPLDGAAAVRELTGPDPIMAAFERAPITADVLTPKERADLDRRRAALPGEIAAGRMRTTEQVQATIERMRTEQDGATVATTPDHVWRGGVLVPVADVENDGDRGPSPSRDPMAAIDQAADAQRAAHVGALLSAVAGLHVDEVRVLAAMARQLPGVRLRAACEAATAQGWVRSGATRVDVPSSPLARAQSSLLGTWREWIALIIGAQSTAARDVAQRDRGDVLADEAARRAGGGE